MTRPKKYIIKLAVACTISFLLLLWMGSSAKATQINSKTPYRVEEFSITTPGQLQVKTSGGYIVVEGSGNNRMRVEMYVSKNGKTLSPSDTDLDDWDIKIEQDGNHIRAIAGHEEGSKWKFWNNNNISISFVVYTPRQMSTDLHTSGGHIKATHLTGHQQIKTSGGHLELADLKGDIHARTSGGHIEIRNVAGQVQARTSGGHIEAQNTRGSLTVHTSGGHIDLKNIAGTVEASTSGGGITAAITEMGKFAHLRTSGGNVRITVPENTGLNLDLHGNRVRTNLQNFSGSMEDNDVKGTISGGGPELKARTSGGTVSVSFQ